ncbi:MAG TPA: TIGR03085 family metal-binding protein [Jatrophihabitans sp.]|jgi:uncharacterized protein (TIGR03085 family)|nr:TIGR03085 family metal-binding protein [Jatrophihabitans sp.]
MVQFALFERHALAETLRCADPHAPTLSGNWTVAQLTAHLVLRERSIVELLGRLPSRRLHRVAQREIDDLVAREPYQRLVDAVDAGPSWRDVRWPVPTSFVWSLPAVRERANLLEYLVHHEDVRRAAAGWAPRSLPDEMQREVWQRLPWSTRLTMRTVPLRIALVWPEHGEVRAGRGATVAVRVTGDPVELTLFAFGRREVARVDCTGAPADVARVLGSAMGL